MGLLTSEEQATCVENVERERKNIKVEVENSCRRKLSAVLRLESVIANDPNYTTVYGDGTGLDVDVDADIAAVRSAVDSDVTAFSLAKDRVTMEAELSASGQPLP